MTWPRCIRTRAYVFTTHRGSFVAYGPGGVPTGGIALFLWDPDPILPSLMRRRVKMGNLGRL